MSKQKVFLSSLVTALVSIYQLCMSFFFSQWYLSLNDITEVKAKRQEISKKNSFDTIKLHQLVKKYLNDSELVEVCNVIGNIIEGLHNYLLVRGEDCDYL